MSRHYYDVPNKNEPTYVLIGWDKTCQGFFMVIEKPGHKKDAPFYSNLFETNSHPKTLRRFLTILSAQHIELPPSLIQEVLQDKKINCGNKDVLHEMKDGRYQRTLGFNKPL